MVEVFKTDVTSNHHARVLVNLIQYHFEDYKVNFDLQDCDNILRIESLTSKVQADPVMNLLKDAGVKVEVLPDDADDLAELLGRLNNKITLQ